MLQKVSSGSNSHAEQNENHLAAKKALKLPAVRFTGQQARSVGIGFASAVQKSRFTIWRCSILPEHVHLVIARHTYKVENIVGLLKGAATKQLKADGLHPFSGFVSKKVEIPTPWSSRCWRVYLDSDESITSAIRYVDQNPVKEGKPTQKWIFESPYRGLEPGWIKYH
jgi:REP element-mobilizing transposase RayT